MDRETTSVALLAQLNRLALTPVEEERFGKDFQDIVAFVGQLAERTAEAPESTGTISGVQNVLRDDVVTPSAEADALVRAAPDAVDYLVRVPPLR